MLISISVGHGRRVNTTVSPVPGSWLKSEQYVQYLGHGRRVNTAVRTVPGSWPKSEYFTYIETAPCWLRIPHGGQERDNKGLFICLLLNKMHIYLNTLQDSRDSRKQEFNNSCVHQVLDLGSSYSFSIFFTVFFINVCFRSFLIIIFFYI